MKDEIRDLLAPFPRAVLLDTPTPLERLERLSEKLKIDLWMKRDDLTGLSFGGNKTRQLEYYLGEARARRADTILITGAVQSNFARSAAAAAARFGMSAVLQREDRVAGMGPLYRSSGNVLLADLLGAETTDFARGEDEAGADAALNAHADALRAKGRRPYVIHLGADHPPLGALGYVRGGAELAAQAGDFDLAIVPSGSGATHAGLLTGLRLAGLRAPVIGICVRRDQEQQRARLEGMSHRLAALMGVARPFDTDEIVTADSALAPGYGRVGEGTLAAIRMMAQTEGIFLDPVYSGKTFAGVLDLCRAGRIAEGDKVVMLHTGGQAALFAYQAELATRNG